MEHCISCFSSFIFCPILSFLWSELECVWPFLTLFCGSLNYSDPKKESGLNLTFREERKGAALPSSRIWIPPCCSLWVRKDMSKLINLSRKHYWPGPSAESVPLLPPHSSSVLLGHITRHCGTAWMLLHTVSSLSVCWCELLSHCSCTATHTCSQGGGGGSRGTHCSAGLEQLWADEIWFSPICSFRRRNPYRMHKQENWSEILLHAASFSVLLPGENEWGLLSYDSWKEIIVCVCVCVVISLFFFSTSFLDFSSF